LRAFAGSVLWGLEEKYKVGMQPEIRIQKGTFYGAHLRTAAHAKAAGWAPYLIQSQNYLFQASKHGLPVIYVASGNTEGVRTFAVEAQNLSMTVVTKESLFQGKGLKNELIQLQNLSWDLLGLADYEVLLRASNFGGTWESSFSWNMQ
jgi:hypothetical protein